MPAPQTLATAHVELFFRCGPWPEEADPSLPSMARHQWAHAAAAGVPSRALAWLETTPLEELGNSLCRGGEEKFPSFSSRGYSALSFALATLSPRLCSTRI